jgi:hypothetical protein
VGSDLVEEIDASTLNPSIVFNLSEELKRSSEVIVASVASIPGMQPAQQDYRIDIADEEDGPPERIERERHQRAEGKSRVLRDSVDTVATEVSNIRVRMRSAWLGSGNCGRVGPVKAC